MKSQTQWIATFAALAVILSATEGFAPRPHRVAGAEVIGSTLTTRPATPFEQHHIDLAIAKRCRLWQTARVEPFTRMVAQTFEQATIATTRTGNETATQATCFGVVADQGHHNSMLYGLTLRHGRWITESY